MPNARNVRQIISDSRKRKYPSSVLNVKKVTPSTPSSIIPIDKTKKVTLDDFYKKATTSKKAKKKVV